MNQSLKRVALVGATVLSLSVLSTPSFAQDAETARVQKPFRVKIGRFFPTDDDVMDFVAKNFMAGGVSYDFGKTKATKPLIYGVYADYTQKKRYGNDLAILGTGVHARLLLTPANDPQGNPYAELGLGYYSITADAPGTDSTSEGKFGGKVALGYQFINGVFGEFEYTLVSGFKKDGFDFNPSGVRASIGYRF